MSKTNNTVTIVIISSRGRGDFTFSKTTKIEDVIAEAREHFGLTGPGTFELFREGGTEPLQRNRPLVSFGVEDGDVFILSSGGVNV